MTRRSWLLVSLTVAAACADATTPAPRAAEASGVRASGSGDYDIEAQNDVPMNETCGHIATGGTGVFDWAVDGVVVAEDTYWIGHANDGSPYTVSIGVVSGSSFTAYHSETFYPNASVGGCLTPP